ncbi:MAG: bifunctional glycosyltransferase family 2/GtrA family protein [Clostridia bacterium]|nr:bifunctional glycosyltransferase family 2/GtrA family protein [Clostridia bacterium]
MDNKNITILIPAYNPTKDLIPLTIGLLENNFNVVVVNDGSKEEANEIFNELSEKITFLIHPHNMGKGQALKTGFKYISKNLPCKGVITADADGQHLLEDIIKIANELDTNSSNLILGSRKLDEDTPFRSKFGNSVTRMIFKVATGVTVYDTQTGLRGIPFKFLEDFIKIEGQRYEYEINMLMYCTKNKINMKEITITTVYLDNNKASSFRIIKDSAKIYKCIFKNSGLLQSILFGISAILSFLIDFVLLLVLNTLTKPLFDENLALLISVVGARIISSLFNFFFNRNIVFQNKSNIFKSLVQYYVLAICVLIVNYLLLNLLTIRLEVNLTLAKILVEVILFINNFIIQKTIIFKRKK